MKRPHLATLLRILETHGVEYVVAGRTAARLHLSQSKELESLAGGPFVDLCYRQLWTNCECLNRALEELDGRLLPESPIPAPITGRLRSADRPLRVSWTGGTLNLLPHVRGLGLYEDLCAAASETTLEGFAIRYLSQKQLLTWAEAACRAIGRPIPASPDALREAASTRAFRWLELEDGLEIESAEDDDADETDGENPAKT